jgi:hypothetical protein
MHEDPFSRSANGDRDRLHQRTAIRRAIAGGVVVDMAAPQTVGAVVAMSGAEGAIRHVEMAVAASERAGSVAPLTAALIA